MNFKKSLRMLLLVLLSFGVGLYTSRFTLFEKIVNLKFNELNNYFDLLSTIIRRSMSHRGRSTLRALTKRNLLHRLHKSNFMHETNAIHALSLIQITLIFVRYYLFSNSKI